MASNLRNVLFMTGCLYLTVTVKSDLNCYKCKYLSVDPPYTDELRWLTDENKKICSLPSTGVDTETCLYAEHGKMAQCVRTVSRFGGKAKSDKGVYQFTGKYYQMGCTESPLGSDESCSKEAVDRRGFDDFIAQKKKTRDVNITSFEGSSCRCNNDKCNNQEMLPLSCYDCDYIEVDSSIENSGVIPLFFPKNNFQNNFQNNIGCKLPGDPNKPAAKLSPCLTSPGKVAKCTRAFISVKTKVGVSFNYYRSRCLVAEKNAPNTCVKMLEKDIKNLFNTLDVIKFDGTGDFCQCDTDACNSQGQTTLRKGCLLITLFMATALCVGGML